MIEETEVRKNSNIVSNIFGASTVVAISTVTALINDASLGGSLSFLLTLAVPTTVAAPLVSFISGKDCKIKAKPFAIGAIGGLALTFGAATFDHYNPTETQPLQSNAIPTITAQRHSKIA
ncbi:MAG: hypothetical protein JKY11_06435 [Alphaproteobacteria bacterium]|nr:hypothetical protein [Alphaproteobacteria bacterium]